MADKAITDLEAASAINGADLFVLQQGDTAKKASGQLLENWLLSMANGHGGIQSIVKTGSTGTNPVVDTYTIEFSDSSTTTFTVTNGKKGAKGDTGAAASVTSSSVQYVESASGTTVPSSGWQDNPPTVAQGNYLWTKVVITFSDGTPVTSYSVARYGVDGSGAVDSVNGQSGAVTLTASDVGALPDTYTPPVTSVNGDTGAVNLDASDVGAVAGDSVSKTISASGWYRVLKHTGSIPDGGIIKFKIGRNQNGDCHEIDLHVPHGHSFVNEISTSGTNFGITKIRLTQGSTYLYADIYYTLSATSIVRVDFIPAGTITQSNIAAESLQSVADATSGETVLATHDFVADTHISGSVAGSYGTIYYDRKGGVCSIYGDVNDVPNGAWTTLATGLPAPARTQFFIAQNGPSNDFVMCQLTTSGTLNFYGRGSYSSGYPTWTYVCN